MHYRKKKKKQCGLSLFSSRFNCRRDYFHEFFVNRHGIFLDMSCRSRLAVLNEKLTTLERRIEYLEACVCIFFILLCIGKYPRNSENISKYKISYLFVACEFYLKFCSSDYLNVRRCETYSQCVSLAPPRAPLRLSLSHSIVFHVYFTSP